MGFLQKDSGPLAGLKSMFEEANEEAKIQVRPPAVGFDSAYKTIDLSS